MIKNSRGEAFTIFLKELARQLSNGVAIMLKIQNVLDWFSSRVNPLVLSLAIFFLEILALAL
jgi:hypothetical protein